MACGGCGRSVRNVGLRRRSLGVGRGRLVSTEKFPRLMPTHLAEVKQKQSVSNATRASRRRVEKLRREAIRRAFGR